MPKFKYIYRTLQIIKHYVNSYLLFQFILSQKRKDNLLLIIFIFHETDSTLNVMLLVSFADRWHLSENGDKKNWNNNIYSVK